MGETYSKNNFIAIVADKAGVNRTVASDVVNATFASIQSVLSNDYENRITANGLFKADVAHRAPRKGRNPRTGEELEIGESWSIRLKPSFGLQPEGSPILDEDEDKGDHEDDDNI